MISVTYCYVMRKAGVPQDTPALFYWVASIVFIGTFALRFVKDYFAHTHTFRSYFYVFILLNIFKRFFWHAVSEEIWIPIRLFCGSEVLECWS